MSFARRMRRTVRRRPAEEGQDQKVTVTSDGKATATFTNLVPTYGRLELVKKNASGTMADVTFTLTSTTDSSKTYTLTTGDNGYGVVVLPKGTYTLTEATLEAMQPMKAADGHHRRGQDHEPHRR